MKQFGNVYGGRRVLLTGHTGFKGSWLALWLQQLGAEVTALALPPETTPNHWRLLGLKVRESLIDLRDAAAVAACVREAQPDIVFHLAAQALVRRSYRDPAATWSSNVLGTVNLLEACRQLPRLGAVVVVTSDKCYENREWVWGYREIDALGGHDHYSASKAATELVVASYRHSHFEGPEAASLATVRAGNVMGGGDWAEDRLIPDLMRAMAKNEPLLIRSPTATRPWQHVLEPLSGYLLLGQRLLERSREAAQAWNFGPDFEGSRTVNEVLQGMQHHWPGLRWQVDTAPQPHEATRLWLDSTKARDGLGWRPVWSFAEGLQATSEWYRTYLERGNVISSEQLRSYVARAGSAGAPWCG